MSNIITRCILLSNAVEIDGQMFIQVEGLKDEILSDIELRQQYGFRSKPPKGTRCTLLSIGGDKSNATAINADSKEIEKTPAWNDGESRQFDDQGARHRIFNGQHIIDAPNGLVINVGGTIYAFTSARLLSTGGGIKANAIDLELHKHTITGGSSAGTTTSSIP